MKKNSIIFCCIVFILLFLRLLTTQKAHAANKPVLSLSDAILADLALHNYLDYISIDLKDTKGPNNFTINETHQWLPASTIKLFVAMYAADQIVRKNISDNQWVTIDAKNVVPTELETSDYPVLTPGLTTTVDVLLKKMITQSDNTAYNTLLDLLDRQKVTQFVQSIGLKHTIIGSKLNLDDDQTQYEYTTPGYNINTTTAADYEKAYEFIDQGKIPGSKALFTILSQQKIQNMIPALLPVKELTIAHKTGDLDPLYHDGGIIIGDNRHYILTIFTNLGNPNIIAHLSQLIFTQNYKLVGADIPDKNTLPAAPQVLDPLVINPNEFQAVLGAATPPVNIPIPQITAADLGITPSDLSLTLPDSKLPPVLISPSSPLHAVVNTWYGLQNVFAVGTKRRQQAALSYAKQLIAESKQLQKSGNTQTVSNNLQQVEQILHAVATNPSTKTDSQTQVDIKAVSDTEFALLKTVVNSTNTDNARIASLQEVANAVKDHLIAVQPNIPDANATTASTNPPLIAHVVNVTNSQATVVTGSGATFTVPLSADTKIITNNTQKQSPVTPAPSGPSVTEEAQSPSPTTQPTEESLQKGQTIALLGTINGKTFTPSVIVTNLHEELAAPQPVTVVKVNTKNNTMVVSENGNPVQIDLGTQTPIKGKDTNIPLQSVQPGDVVVVHGTEVQQVQSDSQPVPLVAPKTTTTPSGNSKSSTQSSQPASESTTSTITPSNKPQVSVTVAQQPTSSITPEITEGKTIHTSLTPTAPSSKVVPTSTGKKTTVTPTPVKPAASTAPATVVQPAPKVIQATSVQIVLPKSAKSPTSAPSQPNTPKPAQQPPAQPAQPAQAAPQPTADNSKKK